MHNVIESIEFDNMRKGPIRRSLFRNGACLLFHEAKGFSGAKVSLNFLAGSIFEESDEEGISHLIEHLVFKEVTTTLVKDLELCGAEINAYTYKENVCFELSCLSTKLPELLPLFLKLFTTLEFTDDQFQKEKLVVLQELNEDKDDHETQGLEYLFKKNFDPKLGHAIGGSEKLVRSFTRKQVQRFYNKFYRSERMILTIVSGVNNLESIESIFQKSFSNEKMILKKPFRIKANQKNRKLLHVKASKRKKMESAILLLSFDGPTINSNNYYDYIVLDELLFEGLSSLFFKKFREENALVYGLGSSINSFAKAGNYIMVFNTQNENMKFLDRGIADVFNGFLDHGAIESEIEQIKTRILDSWEIAFDSIDERAEFISENEVYQQHHVDIKDISLKVKAVRNESIKKLIKKIYIDSPYTKYKILKKEV
ncbi:MAG: putative Zn-dependent peptidase [Bacteriovoracaceae bacterium]|jgi:predicted Zn-dependent peptidase